MRSMRTNGLYLVFSLAIVFATVQPRVVGAQGLTSPRGNEVVGTVQQLDASRHVLRVGSDSAVGQELGQGSLQDVYYTDSVAVTRSGKASNAKAIRAGDRVMIATVTGGDKRLNAQSIRVLYDGPGTGWGHYLHGNVATVNTPSHSINLIQTSSRIRQSVVYDSRTQVVALDGTPLKVTDLKQGDEVDVILRAGEQPDQTALRIMRMR